MSGTAEPFIEADLSSSRLDHIIVVVPDLDDAAHRAEELGFTVTPRSDHPFGTANRLVVFQDNFIEFLAPVPGASLGPYVVVSEFLRANGGPGPWGIIWRADSATDAFELCQRRGLDPSTLQSQVRRQVTTPTNGEVTACFSSFALKQGNTPLYLEGFSQQHVSEAVFDPLWQRHQNQACSISGVDAVGDDAAVRAGEQRWRSLFGDAVSKDQNGVVWRGTKNQYAVSSNRTAAGSLTIRGVTVEVDDLKRTMDVLAGRGAPATDAFGCSSVAIEVLGLQIRFRGSLKQGKDRG